MTLSTKQIQTITELDAKAKQILKHGGDEALLMSLAHKMIAINNIIDTATNEELNAICQIYDGFYEYMNLLDQLAHATADGEFDDILSP